MKIYITIFIIILTVVIYLFVLPRISLFENPEFTKVKKLLPKEALNCPYMLALGVNLGSESYMKKNWKNVVNIIKSGKMPPPGYEHIWSSDEKNRYITELTEWGKNK